MFPRLFEPGKLGTLETKNRLVMPAMGNRLADETGHVTERVINYYVERARGGVGLIITQFAKVTPDSSHPSGLSICDDGFIPGLRGVVEAVHRNGAKIAMQLADLGPIMAQVGRPPGADIMVPTALPWMRDKGGFKEMSLEDVERYENAFAEATRRAKEAGFDAVEFHACHGCLVSAFLSPAMNLRTDEYGGSIENRVRFARRILTKSREKVGPDFPLFFRINGEDDYQGGVQVEEAVSQARLLEQAGSNAVSVSAGLEIWSPLTLPCYVYPPGVLTAYAGKIKKAIGVPVMTVGKIDLPLGERLVEDGTADFIALGRSLLADPHLPNKAREGRLQEINQCIYCNNCLFMGRNNVRSCTVNPFLFREGEYPPRPAAARKRVMVIGGGLAGMQAAIVLKQRGHDVSLYERDAELGGQWKVASSVKAKTGFAVLTDRLSRQLAREGVKVFLKMEAGKDVVCTLNPEAVVLATGAVPAGLDVPGANIGNVVQANDVIAGKAMVGRKVVVIGGRFLGMEVAIDLAEQGKEVALVSRGPIGGKKRPFERYTYKALMRRLIELRVPLYPNCPVLDITGKGVNIECGEGAFLLAADTVVLAVGTRSQNSLAAVLKDMVPELYQIGDCAGPEDARTATYEATTVGLRI